MARGDVLLMDLPLGRLSAEDMARVDAEIWRMLGPDDTDAR